MPVLRDAEIAIVGGGAFGCAVAYFLARAGKRDVVLLEKDDLAAGTTSQAAGLVGQVRLSPARVRVAMFSVRTFQTLARETGRDPDFRQVGSLRLALTAEREAEFRQLAAVGQREGLDVELVPVPEAAKRFPLLDVARVRAALWCPSDGYLQPYGLTVAYAEGARARGVRIHTGTRVLGVLTRDGAVAGVRTDQGDVRADVVVVAAGPWAGRLVASVGVELPIVPVRHQYFVTDPVAGVAPDLPVVRVPDLRLYVRAEVNGLIVGGFEATPTSVDPRGLPPDYRALRVEPGWEALSSFGEDGLEVLPALGQARIASTFRGLPTFTPDGQFCLGDVPGLRGLVMAAGCCAHGVSGSAGLGATVAATIVGEAPVFDVGPARAARFGRGPVDWDAARRAAEGVYGAYYGLPPDFAGASRATGDRA
ncbi:MAG TPA: FAD-binding oxidoreductase [Methylomirabilota bacterium]|jgi:glycine/D-amino acid oxidase-like deaminating enzyme|nr:FAD-binding oxidoreductase [Methylomirabilota bacterium]